MIPNKILMVQPAHFGFNEEAAKTNGFQNEIAQLSGRQIQETALLEFRAFVELLSSNGIEVIVIEDLLDPRTPDAIFPNNWFSTNPHNNKLYTFPMANKVRRDERRKDIVDDLVAQYGYEHNKSLLAFEKNELFLEGTGSMVLDHINKIAYAAISPRTHKKVLEEWCKQNGFEQIVFEAIGPQQEQVYHTNVVMTMADRFVVICLDSVKDQMEKAMLIDCLTKQSEKEIIEISESQMNSFAGNMIQLQNKWGDKFLVMSSTAQASLTKEQIDTFTIVHEHQILAPSINVIETIGGGSARCMIAEIF